MKAVDVLSSSGKSRNIVAGVEILAKAMDSVIMRVQVMLSDSSVRRRPRACLATTVLSTWSTTLCWAARVPGSPNQASQKAEVPLMMELLQESSVWGRGWDGEAGAQF
jgi:hypothetical protein